MYELRQYSKECRISAADDASRRPRAGTAVRNRSHKHGRRIRMRRCPFVACSSTSTGKIAVNGLVLDIPVGSFYGLVGPNGAGKTTTLNMVTGLLYRRRHRHDLGHACGAT